jgi:hypothetical protein
MRPTVAGGSAIGVDESASETGLVIRYLEQSAPQGAFGAERQG